MEKHCQLSYEIASTFETAAVNGAAVSWEGLCVAAPIDQKSGYGIVVQGQKTEDGTRGFSVALRQGFGDGTIIAAGREIFTALAPLDGSYEGLLTAIDKVSAFFEQSLEMPPAAPIFPGFPYGSFTQEVMQPLLDALNKGDFDLAAALTPANYRLCGYQEFNTEHVHEQYGHGWAGQFENTVIPAGRYPVFASKYTYNERKHCYQNDLKDYPGLSIYLCGSCISDSLNRSPDAYPFPNTVWNSPYCHSVAKSILEGDSTIHLIEPFEAVPVHFQYNGEEHTTYDIVDRSLPEQMVQDPMTLRNKSDYIRKTMDLSEKGRGLFDTFLHEYTFRPDFYGGCIPMNVLVNNKDYSAGALSELLSKGMIQRRDCDGVAYELTASEKLHLFHTKQMRLSDSDAYKFKNEYEQIKKEASKKPALRDLIQSASSRSADSHCNNKAPAKVNIPER